MTSEYLNRKEAALIVEMALTKSDFFILNIYLNKIIINKYLKIDFNFIYFQFVFIIKITIK